MELADNILQQNFSRIGMLADSVHHHSLQFHYCAKDNDRLFYCTNTKMKTSDINNAYKHVES